MSKNKKNELKILNENLDYLKSNFNVKKIGIFGSYARGEQKKSSDVDIMVEFSRPVGFFKFVDLENYLGRLLKKQVDLTTKNSLKPIIKKEILKDLIYA